MSAGGRAAPPDVLNFLRDDLARLDEHSLRRNLRLVSQVEGARLSVDGRALINFSSNDYLNLSRHPQVLEAVRQVLDHWGVGATSSRLISGTTVIHHDLELALAAFFQREAALVFPAGYMANLAAVTALAGAGDAVIVDRLSHASLIDAARLSGARLFVYRHADAEDAGRVLRRAAAYRRRLLVSDSVFSMDGDFAPVERLGELCREHEAMFLLDEAHAIGLWGPQGRGLDAARPQADVLVGTLSKALGSQGGFVCGRREVIDTFINRGRSFIFTTGLSPACVAGAQAALSLIQENPEPARRVERLSARLREGLRQAGFDTRGSQSQIVPVLLGEADRALACAAHLQAAGFFAPAIRAPTVHAGQCRIRFSVTAGLREAEVDGLIEALTQWRSRSSGRSL